VVAGYAQYRTLRVLPDAPHGYACGCGRAKAACCLLWWSESMLEVNPETIRFLIDRAQEFQIQDETSMPEDVVVQDDDWLNQVRELHGDDPVYQEIKTTIEDLEPDQQMSLVALMWVGRGDFDADEWDAAFEQARESWNERTAEYLIGTPLLADYLAEGLDAMSDVQD
jgi:hypothetical protein